MNDRTDTTEDLSKYKITSRREIISLLRSVATNNQLIQMTATAGVDSVLTAILEVDDSDDTIVVDGSKSALINQRMLESEKLAFETALDNIRITFRASAVESCDDYDRPALRIALPDTMIRLQRREFYRVQTPVVKPVMCSLTVDADGGALKTAVPLYNVSGGGISLIDDKEQLNADFGRIYKDCRLELPGGAVVVTLQIRSAQNATLGNGKKIRRLGCKFVDPSPATLAAVQRYITRLEREQNARTVGLR